LRGIGGPPVRVPLDRRAAYPTAGRGLGPLTHPVHLSQRPFLLPLPRRAGIMPPARRGRER
ncbi:MAG: hypothetical protein K2W96_08420, partial [Gemmataceae bacterium]|nr:hypothetical protein [Gemmataceae bacterium]